MSDTTQWEALRTHWGSWVIVDVDGKTVALVDDRYTQHGYGSTYETEQRAYLWAAAPQIHEALQKQQAVEDHTLECLYCLHDDDCNERQTLTADANVARVDALAAATPPPAGAAAEGGPDAAL